MASKSASRKDLLHFEIRSSAQDGPRLGLLSFADRVPMETPNFIPVSSRGAIPHISQDNVRDHTPLQSMYTALEDYIERAPSQTPPVYTFPASEQESPLRKFIALQKSALLVLGPRRLPPLPCPGASSSTSLAIVTSLGFGMLECDEYVMATQKLKPDIVVGLGDVLYGHQPGVKRMERMADRTQSWLNALIAGMNDHEHRVERTALFAPLLPIEAEKQSWYLAALNDDFRADISGLALYENDSVAAVPPSLSDLPRLFMGDVKTPQQLLDSIDVGMDIFAISFINESTDAGFALDFAFVKAHPVADTRFKLPLVVDMWSNDHAKDLSPLRHDCRCYACTNHHRAYVLHLLKTGEMLAWVLLQLHNYHVMSAMFEAIRQSLARGSFEVDKQHFVDIYEHDWPIKTGQGPRARGYQFRSEGKGEPKKNKVPYRSLNDRAERLKDGARLSPKTTAVDLEQTGFAEMFDDAQSTR